jgi:hypothetical protein
VNRSEANRRIGATITALEPRHDKQVGVGGRVAAVSLRNVQKDHRVVLRSRHQLISGVGFGVLVLVLGLLGASQDAYRAGELIDGIGAAVIGTAMITAFLRAKVIATDEGVRIFNLGQLRSATIPWSQITGFRIGRHRLLSAVCLVDLLDGTSRPASAIALPQINRSVSDSKEMKMIELLNDEAAAHGAPLRNRLSTS